MKDFHEELYRIFNIFKARDSFLFGKFADGELMAIENVELDNSEFQNNHFVPQSRRTELLDALQYKHDNYFVGQLCPCCTNRDGREIRMRNLAGQDDEHSSFANLLVNANYPLYKETFVKEYTNHEVYLVAHESSKIENLPFKVSKFYPIRRNAWVNDYDLIKKMQDEDLSGKLILMSCGPMGNLLGHQLFQTHPNNRILDVGSSLNEWIQSQGFVRDFLDSNSVFGRRKCIWE